MRETGEAEQRLGGATGDGGGAGKTQEQESEKPQRGEALSCVTSMSGSTYCRFGWKWLCLSSRPNWSSFRFWPVGKGVV